jgi:hypothetical protein
MSREGIEPPTFGLKVRCSTVELPAQFRRRSLHLSYTPHLQSGWWRESNPRMAVYKTAALPSELHQHQVGMRGVEPLTSVSQTQYATNYTTPRFRPTGPGFEPGSADSKPTVLPPRPSLNQFDRWDRSRTCSLRFWRPLLHQLSYPPTSGLVAVEPCGPPTLSIKWEWWDSNPQPFRSLR